MEWRNSVGCLFVYFFYNTCQRSCSTSRCFLSLRYENGTYIHSIQKNSVKIEQSINTRWQKERRKVGEHFVGKSQIVISSFIGFYEWIFLYNSLCAVHKLTFKVDLNSVFIFGLEVLQDRSVSKFDRLQC